MKQYEVLSTIPFWIIMAMIIALHIAAVFVRQKSRTALFVVSGVNMLMHFVLIGYMLMKTAEPYELFFALLLSTAAALLTTRRREKGEGKDGI